MTKMHKEDLDSVSRSSELAFRKAYTDLLKNGKPCSPRGQLVIELEHYTYELPAYSRFPNFEGRKLSLDYIKREFLWYLRGNRMDASITKYAKIWADVQNQDGSINSNYGQYIFNRKMVYNSEGAMVNVSPFERVVNELLKDKDSRRASISILNSNHFNGVTKDVPCTYSLNFRIRDDKLNMSVHMRSQDAVFGMGNDAPCFSFIHEMVFAALEEACFGLELGTYTHTSDSFHVYERHFKLVEAIVEGAPYIPTECPFINGIEEVRHLTFGIHGRYPLGANAWCYEQLAQPREPLMAFETPKALNFDHLVFSDWLLEPEVADATNKSLSSAT
jgi:thymidylate synthase